MKEWFKKWWPVGLAALLGLLVGTAGGFFGKPAEIREVTKTEYKDKLVYVEKTLTQDELNRLVDEAVKKRTHRTWVVTKTPDGTVTKTGTETTEVDATKKTVEVQIKTVYVDKFVYRDVLKTEYKEKIVKNQPNWLVTVGGGVNVPFFLGKPEQGIPGLKGAVIEAGVSRRIVGPFYIGLFGSSSGNLGLNLTGAF